MNLKSLKVVLEEKDLKPVVMSFGRFNPITSGHERLVNAVRGTAHELNAPHHIIVSHSQDAKKNPLSAEQKVKHAKRAFPGANIVGASKDAPTLLHHAARLHAAGHRHLVMVAGSDRVEEYQNLLNKYNGVPGTHGHYKFDKIEVRSAGHRDPDSEGTEGISASKMREHAKSGNYDSFARGAPKTMAPEHVRSMYNDTRKGMGINESYRGRFKAIFVTGGPSSGKDIIIHEAIAESNITEIQVSQAYDLLNNKKELSESTKDVKLQAIQNRCALVINGPTETHEKIMMVKEELEELGYETFMVFVNTTDEVSMERNHHLTRVMVEEVRHAKWCSAQDKIQHFYDSFDNFILFDNSTDLKHCDIFEEAIHEDNITDILNDINGFLDTKTKTISAEEWSNRRVNINMMFMKEMIQPDYTVTRSAATKWKKGPKGDTIKGNGGGDKSPNASFDSSGAYAEGTEPTVTFNGPPRTTNFQKDKESKKKERQVREVPGKKIDPDGIQPSWDLRTNTGSGGYLGGIRAEGKTFNDFRKIIESDYSPDDSGNDSAYLGNTGAMDKEPIQTYSDKYKNISVQIRKRRKI